MESESSYRILSELGRGSFGSALLAEVTIPTPQSFSRVVIKRTNTHAISAKQRAECENEVSLLKALDHPHIIRYITSFFDSKNCFCIVMEFAENGDLFKRISAKRKNNERFTENQVMRWFIQITYALDHVHRRKILHRDLKSQNIFLARDDNIKLGDLGIGKELEHTQDMAKTCIGTPYNMSPELCNSEPYSFKSDIWALGCVVYELTMLKMPFDAKDMVGLLSKILRGQFVPVDSRYYNRELSSLVQTMLAQQPDRRPSTDEILNNSYVRDWAIKLGELQVDRMTPRDRIRPFSAPTNPVSEQASLSPAAAVVDPSEMHRIRAVPPLQLRPLPSAVSDSIIKSAREVSKVENEPPKPPMFPNSNNNGNNNHNNNINNDNARIRPSSESPRYRISPYSANPNNPISANQAHPNNPISANNGLERQSPRQLLQLPINCKPKISALPSKPAPAPAPSSNINRLLKRAEAERKRLEGKVQQLERQKAIYQPSPREVESNNRPPPAALPRNNKPTLGLVGRHRRAAAKVGESQVARRVEQRQIFLQQQRQQIVPLPADLRAKSPIANWKIESCFENSAESGKESAENEGQIEGKSDQAGYLGFVQYEKKVDLEEHNVEIEKVVAATENESASNQIVETLKEDQTLEAPKEDQALETPKEDQISEKSEEDQSLGNSSEEDENLDLESELMLARSMLLEQTMVVDQLKLSATLAGENILDDSENAENNIDDQDDPIIEEKAQQKFCALPPRIERKEDQISQVMAAGAELSLNARVLLYSEHLAAILGSGLYDRLHSYVATASDPEKDVQIKQGLQQVLKSSEKYVDEVWRLMQTLVFCEEDLA